MNHWYRWADDIEKEALFQDVRQLIEDMINEKVPIMIEKYFNEKVDTLNINI